MRLMLTIGGRPIVIAPRLLSARVAATRRAERVAPRAAIAHTATGLTVRLGARTPGLPEGSVSCTWSFGDGAQATGVAVEHTFTTEGTWTVTLTVVDAGGATATTTQDVTVALPSPPTLTAIGEPEPNAIRVEVGPVPDDTDEIRIWEARTADRPVDTLVRDADGVIPLCRQSGRWLVTGEEYTYWATRVAGGTESGPSNRLSWSVRGSAAEPQPEPEPEPVGITATADPSDPWRFVLTWPADADGYQLNRVGTDEYVRTTATTFRSPFLPGGSHTYRLRRQTTAVSDADGRTTYGYGPWEDAPTVTLAPYPAPTGDLLKWALPPDWGARSDVPGVRTVDVSQGDLKVTIREPGDWVVRFPADRALELPEGRRFCLDVICTTPGAVRLSVVGGEIKAAPRPSHGVGMKLYGRMATADDELTVFLEGLRLSGGQEQDSLEIDVQTSLSSKVVIQNCHFERIYGTGPGAHADNIQTWGGPCTLLLYRFHGESDYQGLFLHPTQFGILEREPSRFGAWDLDRVHIHQHPQPSTGGAGVGYYSLHDWDTHNPRITTTECYQTWEPGMPAPSGNISCGAPERAGNQTPGTWSGVIRGVTPPASVAPLTGAHRPGVGYVSPGYAGQSAPAPEPAPNTAPTALFTCTATDLSVAADATGSTDTDGTVAGYLWTWGDGATSAGVTASHTYAAAGTYTVTLSVTDDDGATATTSHPVTVTAPPPPAPTLLSLEEVPGPRVRATCTEVPGATYLWFESRTAAKGPIGTTTVPSRDSGVLTPGNTYTYWVRAEVGGVQSVDSGTTSITLRPPVGQSKQATIDAAGIRPLYLPPRTTTHTGNLVITGDGEVHENLVVTGWVEDHGRDTVLRNVEIRVGPLLRSWSPPTQAGIFRLGSGDETGSLYENVYVNPSHPTVDTYGILGGGYTLRHSEIVNVVDHVQINNPRAVVVEACYFHLGRWYAKDPRQKDGSHSDVIQVLVGRNRRIVGNVVHTGTVRPRDRTDGSNSSSYAVLVSPTDTRNPVGDVVIDRNWFAGAGFSHVKVGEQGRGLVAPLAITGNRFESRTGNAAIHGTRTTIDAATITGNTGPDGAARPAPDVWADPATT